MGSEDGSLFIKNLAYFVRTHERALANALQVQQQSARNASSSTSLSGRGPSSTSEQKTSSYASSALAAALSFQYLTFPSTNVQPAKLTLTPHHLYYLLSRFEELGISVGPMNVRLENIHSGSSPTRYVSFLAQAQRQKGRSSDKDSTHSVSSVRSVLSMSSLWSSFGLSSGSAGKSEKQRAAILEDLRYLYSAFTKIPCLRLAHDRKARLIQGFEEFPFDTAVPAFVFKNVSALEICDVDFRQFFGWDRLAEQLRSITVKRAALHDVSDLLTNIVLDDMDRRRRRSAKEPPSPTLTWVSPNPVSSPGSRDWQTARGQCDSGSPKEEEEAEGRSDINAERPTILRDTHSGSQNDSSQRPGNVSPPRPPSSRHDSSNNYGGRGGLNARRYSVSSSSSDKASTPHSSSSNFLQLGVLPPSKWRFLKHLSLADNGLTSVSATSLAPLANTLQSLDLSSNLFVEIPDSLASLTALRALNLENCMIDSLHSLTRSPLPAISTLNLRANRLVSLAGIERLLSLERLDLRENKLSDCTELARLTGIPDIREIFVNRNPFVKTHSQYRITIFNLFRRTPGYTEDMVLDSAGPSYNERRQLVDRAPEVINMPNVQPLAEERPVTPVKGNSVVRQKVEQDESTRDTQLPDSSRTPGTEYAASPQRRRKVPRRRTVDLSNGNDGSTYFLIEAKTSLSATNALGDSNGAIAYGRTADTTNIDGPRQAQAKIPLTNSAAISAQGAGVTEESSKEAQVVKIGGEVYRRKMEALRNDIGSGWLSSLGDDAWDERRAGRRLPYDEKDRGDSSNGKAGYAVMSVTGQA